MFYAVCLYSGDETLLASFQDTCVTGLTFVSRRIAPAGLRFGDIPQVGFFGNPVFSVHGIRRCRLTPRTRVLIEMSSLLPSTRQFIAGGLQQHHPCSHGRMARNSIGKANDPGPQTTCTTSSAKRMRRCIIGRKPFSVNSLRTTGPLGFGRDHGVLG